MDGGGTLASFSGTRRSSSSSSEELEIIIIESVEELRNGGKLNSSLIGREGKTSCLTGICGGRVE